MESNIEEKKVMPEYAPPTKRMFSTALDNLILSIPIMLVFLLFARPIFNSMNSMDLASPTLSTEFIMLNVGLLLFYVFIIITYATVLIGKTGATFGQRALKVRVVTEEQSDLGYKKAFIRALAYLIYNIPYAGSLLVVVSAIMLFRDSKRQTLHDKMCKTIVINQ